MGPYKGSVELGARLRQQRKERRLSQEAAGAEVGVTQSRWSRWEDGKLMPHPGEFGAIALFLGISRAEVISLAFSIKESTEARLTRLETSLEEIRALLRDMSGSAGATQPGKR